MSIACGLVLGDLHFGSDAFAARCAQSHDVAWGATVAFEALFVGTYAACRVWARWLDPYDTDDELHEGRLPRCLLATIAAPFITWLGVWAAENAIGMTNIPPLM